MLALPSANGPFMYSLAKFSFDSTFVLIFLTIICAILNISLKECAKTHGELEIALKEVVKEITHQHCGSQSTLHQQKSSAQACPI